MVEWLRPEEDYEKEERRIILEFRYQEFVVEWLTFLSGIRDSERERDEL